MKRSVFLMLLSLVLILTACNSGEPEKGLALPFSIEEVERIDLTYHTGDLSDSNRRRVTGSEDIQAIYNLLSYDIIVNADRAQRKEPESTLYITFCMLDGTGYKITYDSFGVKSGTLSSDDFTYFTPSDIGWVWDQLTTGYETEHVSICIDPNATEMPVPIEDSLANATDVELIEAIISSQAIEDWFFMSSTPPTSAEGIEKLCENCDALKELLSRETGLASLKYESPALIEAYKNSGEGHDGLKATALEFLNDYLCADLSDESK